MIRKLERVVVAGKIVGIARPRRVVADKYTTPAPIRTITAGRIYRYDIKHSPSSRVFIG